MIGIDTNVLVRYLTQDDPKQSAVASQLFAQLNAENLGFITTVSLIELVWVLKSCYETSKEELIDCLELLMHTQGIVIQDIDTARKALRLFKKSTADFADCMIYCASHAAGCISTMTFDTAAAKSCGMTLINKK